MAVASAGPRANHFAPRSRQITTPALITQFLQDGCSSWRPTHSVKAPKTNMKCLIRRNYSPPPPPLPPPPTPFWRSFSRWPGLASSTWFSSPTCSGKEPLEAAKTLSQTWSLSSDPDDSVRALKTLEWQMKKGYSHSVILPRGGEDFSRVATK